MNRESLADSNRISVQEIVEVFLWHTAIDLLLFLAGGLALNGRKSYSEWRAKQRTSGSRSGEGKGTQPCVPFPSPIGRMIGTWISLFLTLSKQVATLVSPAVSSCGFNAAIWNLKRE
jgi:hypothetical protein